MRRYVLRGFEGNIVNVLKDKGIVYLIGLSGVGKTTTARYLGIKLKSEGYKVVCLGLERKKIQFYDENGEEHEIHVLPVLKGIEALERGNVSLALSLADDLIGIVNGVLFGSLDEIKEKFDVFKRIWRKVEERLEKIHESSIRYKIAMEEMEKEEELKEFIHEISHRIKEELKRGFEGVLARVKDALAKNWDVVKDFKDVAEFLMFVGSAVMLGYTLYSAGKGVVEVVKKRDRRKLKGNVVFIVDDIAGLKEREDEFLHFAHWILESGGKVIVVKRLSFKEFFEVYEALELAKAGKREFDRGVLGVLGRLVSSLNQIFLIDAVDFERFKEILDANGYELERVKEVMKTDRGDVLNVLYRATAGSVLTALYMLDLKIEFDEIYKLGEGLYHSAEEIEKASVEERVKMTHDNKTVMLAGIYTIYKKLRKENFAFVPLMLQDVAEDELEKFCDDERIDRYCKRRGLKSYPIFDEDHYIFLIEKKEVRDDREFKVYDLNERWKKMKTFVLSLCEVKGYKEVLEDLRVVREVMLDIMSDWLKENGGANGRMCVNALGYAEWLIRGLIPKVRVRLDRDIGEKGSKVDEASDEEVERFKDLSEKLTMWCRFALSKFPRLGYVFEGLTLECVDLGFGVGGDAEVYLSFLYALVERLKLRGYSEKVDYVERLVRGIEGNDIVNARKLEILSVVARIKEDVDEIRGLKGEAEKLPEDLGDFVKAFINLDLADVYLGRGNVSKALEVLKENEEILKSFKGLSEKDLLVRYFKVYGGDPVRIAEKSLKDAKAGTYYNSAIASVALGNFDEALRYFERAKSIYEELEDYAKALKCEGFKERIKFIRDGKADFGRIVKMAEEKIVHIDPLDYSSYIAQDIVYKAFLGLKFEREEIENPFIRRITKGFLALLGYEDLNAGIRSLEEFEVEVGFEGFRRKYLFSMFNASGWLFKLLKRNPVFKFHLREFSKRFDENFEDKLKKFLESAQLLCIIVENFYQRLKGGESLEDLKKDKKGLIFKFVAERILTEDPSYSDQALARILRLYLSNDVEGAKALSERVAKAYPPLLSKLFKELSEALGSGDKEKIKLAFLKLFYLHF